MFPNVRLLVAAMIGSVVALSCGFGIFAALRINHEPLARLPSGSAPLQLLASISPSPPIAVAAVESIERGLRAGDTRGGAGLADAPAASDREADTPSPEPQTSSGVEGNASATAPAPAQEALAPAAEHETNPPDADATSHDSAPAPVPAPSVTAIEAPPEQSVLIEPEEQDGVLAPASVPQAAETAASKGATKAAAKSARKKKTVHTHVAARTRTRRPRPDGMDGFASSNTAGSNTARFNTQESTSAIGGPFVSPAAW
jgi:hypothetical protein